MQMRRQAMKKEQYYIERNMNDMTRPRRNASRNEDCQGPHYKNSNDLEIVNIVIKIYIICNYTEKSSTNLT